MAQPNTAGGGLGSLKIIGAGMGRSGTSSLKSALEILGFSPCYHMTDFYQNADEQLSLWRDARSGKPDWNQIFAGYQATVDWPACYYWKELADHFPEAKVILNHRDPDRWYDSMLETIHWAAVDRGSNMERALAATFDEDARRFQEVLDIGTRKIIFQDHLQGNFSDRQWAVSFYREHIEAVKQAIPPERLLLYEVRQGWEPLCNFLEVSVPQQPFPNQNDRDAFRTAFSAKSSLFRELGQQLVGVDWGFNAKALQGG